MSNKILLVAAGAGLLYYGYTEYEKIWAKNKGVREPIGIPFPSIPLDPTTCEMTQMVQAWDGKKWNTVEIQYQSSGMFARSLDPAIYAKEHMRATRLVLFDPTDGTETWKLQQCIHNSHYPGQPSDDDCRNNMPVMPPHCASPVFNNNSFVMPDRRGFY